MQAYVSAAAKISRSRSATRRSARPSPPIRRRAACRRPSTPKACRSARAAASSSTHIFPLDAEYEFRVARTGGGFGLAAVGADEPVEITLDGARLLLLERDAPRVTDPRSRRAAHASASPSSASANARGVDDLFSELGDQLRRAELSTVPARSMPTGPGDTPSRRKIFVCRRHSERRAACARKILAGLATRAFRRRSAESDRCHRPADRLLQDRARRFEGSTPASSTRWRACSSIRSSSSASSASRPACRPAPSIASATSSSRRGCRSSSGAACRRRAAGPGRKAGTLPNPAVLEQQTRRMLADPRPRRWSTTSPASGCCCAQLDSVVAWRRRSSTATCARRSGAKPSCCSRRSARGPQRARPARRRLHVRRRAAGEALRHPEHPRQPVPARRRCTASARRGLLGQGSILTVTSAGNRTSPVKRGKWILENLLGAPVPRRRPASRPTSRRPSDRAARRSLRQRLEQHRANPAARRATASWIRSVSRSRTSISIGKWRDADGGVADGRLGHAGGRHDARRARRACARRCSTGATRSSTTRPKSC